MTTENEIFSQEMRRLMSTDYLNTMTMEQLYDKVYESRPQIVDGLLNAGTYILAGSPKLGKSYLVLQLAWHISKGLPIWGLNVNQGDTLYLALEDPERNVQSRMFRMFGCKMTKNLHVCTYSQGLGAGLVTQLENFLKEHPETKLIIIDTFQKVRGEAREYSYASDYASIGGIKAITDKHPVCILLVHHTRKQHADDGFDMISGTTGLMGAADGAFIFRKEKRTSDLATLEVTGREQQDQKLYLRRNRETLSWELERMETELWKEPPDPTLEKLSSYLNDCGRWSGKPTDLVQALGIDMKANALTQKLNVNAGRLQREYGIRYSSSRSHTGRKIELRRDAP